MTSKKPVISESLLKQLNSNDLHYFNLLSNRIRKLNESNLQTMRKLPQIYAKAEEVNRRLRQMHSDQDLRATSELILSLGYAHSSQQHDNSNSSTCEPYQNNKHQGNLVKKAKSSHDVFAVKKSSKSSKQEQQQPASPKEKDYYTPVYQKMRRRGMVIPNSDVVDSDLRARLIELKNCELPYFILHRKSSDEDADDNDPLREFRYGTYYTYDQPVLKKQGTMHSNGDESEYGNDEHHLAAATAVHDDVTYPSFGSFLSRDGQYALMKSLEDLLVKELEINYPDMTNKLPRTTTAQYIKLRTRKKKKRASNLLSNANNYALAGIAEAALSTSTTASTTNTAKTASADKLAGPPASYYEPGTSHFSEGSAALLHSNITDSSTVYAKSSSIYPASSSFNSNNHYQYHNNNSNSVTTSKKAVSFLTANPLPRIYNCPSLSDDFTLPYERSEIVFEAASSSGVVSKDDQYLCMPTSKEELEKKLIVTKQIKSGMGILDNIRRVSDSKKKSLAGVVIHSDCCHKKIGFVNTGGEEERRRVSNSGRNNSTSASHGGRAHQTTTNATAAPGGLAESSNTIIVRRRGSSINSSVMSHHLGKYRPRLGGGGAMLVPIKKKASLTVTGAADLLLERQHHMIDSGNNNSKNGELQRRTGHVSPSASNGYGSRCGSTLNKPDPITRYSEWKNLWMKQLSSI